MEIKRSTKLIEYFYQVSDYFMKLLTTNLLFCLSCLPIITIPNAIYALFTACKNINNKEDFSVLAIFWEAFTVRPKSQLKLGVLMMLLTLLFIYDISYLALINQLTSWLGAAVFISILLSKSFFEVSLWLMTESDFNSLKELLVQAYLLVLSNLRVFSSSIAIDLLLILMMLLSFNLRMLVLFLSAFVMAALYGILKCKLFKQFKAVQ